MDNSSRKQLHKDQKKYGIRNNASFYVFAFLAIALPLSFWKGLENSFDIVKSFVFSITGSLFIILTLLSVEKSKSKYNYEFAIDYKFDLPVFLLLASIIISSIFSINFYSSVNGSYDKQMGMIFFISIVIIYFLSPMIFNSAGSTNKLLFIIETAGFIVALFPVIEILGANPFGIRPQNFTRPFSSVGHPAFTGGFLTLIVPISLLNISGKKNIFLKYVYPSVIIAGILLTYTRTSIAALIFQVLISIIMMIVINRSGKINFRKMVKYTSYVIVPLIVILALAMKIFPDTMPVKRIQSLSHLTTQPRWYLWHDSYEMLRHNLLTGTGPGNFSYVFEDYAGYQLKLSEIGRVYDNAHNNLMNTFCTAGMLGGLSYAFLVLLLLALSFRLVVNEKLSRNNRIFFLFILCSFFGYALYGLADFDDITITFYFFVLISIFKSKLLILDRESYRLFKLNLDSSGRYLLIIAAVIYSVYISYSSTMKLIAEKKYSEGLKMYNAGNFPQFQSLIKEAINLESGQMQYRFKNASYIFDYCTRNNMQSVDTKNKLFEQAKNELVISKEKYISKMKCLELLSLIELEEGNKEEGLKIRDEIFRKDTCRFSYRTNLAMYYLKNNEDSLAFNELQFILKYDPKGITANCAYETYLEKNKKYEEALGVCRTILEIEPNNEFGRESFARLSQLIKMGK